MTTIRELIVKLLDFDPNMEVQIMGEWDQRNRLDLNDFQLITVERPELDQILLIQ